MTSSDLSLSSCQLFLFYYFHFIGEGMGAQDGEVTRPGHAHDMKWGNGTASLFFLTALQEAELDAKLPLMGA